MKSPKRISTVIIPNTTRSFVSTTKHKYESSRKVLMRDHSSMEEQSPSKRPARGSSPLGPAKIINFTI